MRRWCSWIVGLNLWRCVAPTGLLGFGGGAAPHLTVWATTCRPLRGLLVRESGDRSLFRIQDSGFRIQDSGFRNSGFRIQDSGFRISGFRIQDSGSSFLSIELRTLNFELLTLQHLCDCHQLHVGCAFVDRADLGVAPEFLDRVILDVTVTAVYFDGFR